MPMGIVLTVNVIKSFLLSIILSEKIEVTIFQDELNRIETFKVFEALKV